MCFSRCLCRVISLEIDGWDHWVVPAVNGFLGVDVVNKEDECRWVLFRAAYTAGLLFLFACETAVLAILKIWMSSPVEESGAGRLGLRVRKSRVAFRDSR